MTVARLARPGRRWSPRPGTGRAGSPVRTATAAASGSRSARRSGGSPPRRSRPAGRRRGPTARRWTGSRCARPTSPPRGRGAAVRRVATGRPGGAAARRVVRVDRHRRPDAGGRRHRGRAGAAAAAGGRRRCRHRRRARARGRQRPGPRRAAGTSARRARTSRPGSSWCPRGGGCGPATWPPRRPAGTLPWPWRGGRSVAIIPTGDEIRPVGTVPRFGDIIDTNSLMLAARCRQLGARPGGQRGGSRTTRTPWRWSSARRPARPTWSWSSPGRAGGAATTPPPCSPRSAASPWRASRSGPVIPRCSATRSGRRPGHPGPTGPGSRRSSALPGYPLATAVIFELFAVPLLGALTGQAHGAGPRPARGSTATGPPPPTSRTGCWSRWPGPAGGVPVATPGQARGGLDQPARPRRRLVAGPARPGRVPGRHRDRGHPDPGRLLRLTPPHDRGGVRAAIRSDVAPQAAYFTASPSPVSAGDSALRGAKSPALTQSGPWPGLNA